MSKDVEVDFDIDTVDYWQARLVGPHGQVRLKINVYRCLSEFVSVLPAEIKRLGIYVNLPITGNIGSGRLRQLPRDSRVADL